MKTDLELLIETADRLSNRLEEMANDEKRFAWQIGDQLEKLAYSTFCTANELKEINSKLVGGVA